MKKIIAAGVCTAVAIGIANNYAPESPAPTQEITTQLNCEGGRISRLDKTEGNTWNIGKFAVKEGSNQCAETFAVPNLTQEVGRVTLDSEIIPSCLVAENDPERDVIKASYADKNGTSISAYIATMPSVLNVARC